MGVIKNIMWEKTVDKVIKIVIGILFSIMTLCIFLAVVNRMTIKISLSWAEEVARFSMIWMTFLSLGIGLRRGAHLGVEIIVTKLKPNLRVFAGMLSIISFIAFSIIIIFTSAKILRVQLMSHQVSAALSIPMFIPYLAIPVGMVIALIEEVGLLISQIKLFRIPK